MSRGFSGLSPASTARAMILAMIAVCCAPAAQARDCSLRCVDEKDRTIGYLKWLCPDTRACSGSCGTSATGCMPIVDKPPSEGQPPAPAPRTQK